MSQNQKLRLGASSAILAPIIAFTFITVALAFDPTFNWVNNALSDLGVVSGLSGYVFNFGLVASGLLAFSFAFFGLLNYFKSVLGKAASITFAAASLALLSIGIFNENFSPTHYLLSVAFFTLAPVAMFALSCAFALSHQRKIAAFSFSITALAVLPWLLEFAFHYVPNVAVPEAVSALAVSAWAIVLGKKMLSVKSSA
jgi:hypothetical membrane protein